MTHRKSAHAQRRFWPSAALKRASLDAEAEIREAFCEFLSDCRVVVAGKLIKQQLDSDLKFVSAALGERKPSSAGDSEP